MQATEQLGLQRKVVAGFVLGAAAASLVLTNGLVPKTMVCLALLAAPIAWWLLCKPNRWIYSFIVAAWLLPPLPLRLGDSGPHVAVVFAAAGLFIGLIRASEWTFRTDSLSTSLWLMLAVMFGSSALSALYSGPDIATGSMARTFLFGIAIYTFFYIRCRPFSDRGRDARILVRLLFWVASASASFALVDFYFHFPAPAGYEAQFVWLEAGVFRRAQGVFYESSTLGNLCVFFLDMIAAALLCYRELAPPIKRWILPCGALPLLGALVLSYSRASVVNLLVGICAMMLLRRRQISPGRLIAGLGTILIAAFALLIKLFPTFATEYWSRLSNTIKFFLDSPDAILSGRLHSWETLGGFLMTHPWHLFFGVGYKSLPYTNIAGASIVADNTYLSALVEMGVLGMAALLFFNVSILRTSYRASRAVNPNRAFYGTWMYCFWIGQMIQMFSADLLTYWRVLPAYLCILAVASKDDHTFQA